MVMNKKGLIKIVEATVAVIIIFSVLLIMMNKDSVDSEDLNSLITPILEEIAQNSDYRERIVTNDLTVLDELGGFVGDRIERSYIGHGVEICALKTPCAMNSFPDSQDGNVYSQERVISTYLGNDVAVSKKVKVFLWRK